MTEPSLDIGKSRADIEEDEINLLDLWRVIWKWRKLIGALVIVIVFFTVGVSLFMKNIYQSKVLIIPITNKDSGGGGGCRHLPRSLAV